MALANQYVQCYGQIPDLFKKISEGQAPKKFTQQHLKDIGLTSVNHRAFIPLLKVLGFLTPEGEPTQRYHSFRDPSQARSVLGDAIKEAYGDVFVIKAQPTKDDREAVEGKFKSTHNTSDRVATLMANTFFSLLDLADLKRPSKEEMPKKDTAPTAKREVVKEDREAKARTFQVPGLHYDIQIHLPATKDIEVYNAIFKSLREHLFET